MNEKVEIAIILRKLLYYFITVFKHCEIFVTDVLVSHPQNSLECLPELRIEDGVDDGVDTGVDITK